MLKGGSRRQAEDANPPEDEHSRFRLLCYPYPVVENNPGIRTRTSDSLSHPCHPSGPAIRPPLEPLTSWGWLFSLTAQAVLTSRGGDYFKEFLIPYGNSVATPPSLFYRGLVKKKKKTVFERDGLTEKHDLEGWWGGLRLNPVPFPVRTSGMEYPTHTPTGKGFQRGCANACRNAFSVLISGYFQP